MSVSVKQDANGIWYARQYLGTDPVTKKKIRPYKQFPEALTREEAQKMADAWASGLGRPLPELCELYIQFKEIRGLFAPSTADTYRSITRAQVAPLLSSVNARHVSVRDITNFSTLLLTPTNKGGRGLTCNSVRKTYSFLRGAFKWLKKEGYIDENPMPEADIPTVEYVEARFLDPDEYRKLNRTIDRILGDPNADKKLKVAAVGAQIAFHNGTRISETCALQRRNVNPIGMTMGIRRGASETKSSGFHKKRPKRNSMRNIEIDQETVDALNKSRELQESLGCDVSSDSYVVSFNGKMTRPSDLRRWFKLLLSKAGLPAEIKFHSLRHTHVTFLIARGLDAKSIADRVGDNVSTLMRIYAHVMPGRDREAAETISQISKELS